MKKSLIATLTSALVLGTFSTSLAASNPFKDVQPTHWAYKAVSELADAGIIEGYGDYNVDINLQNTFSGGRTITRYEMAQMIAKALARVEGETSPFNVHLVGHQWHYTDDVGRDHIVDGKVVPWNGGITIDMLNKLRDLVYEFKDDLDVLGVRVKDLEDHTDAVNWTGELRYRYYNNKTDVDDGDSVKSTRNQVQLRLFPTATISDHWKAKARLTASHDMSADTTGNVALTYIYAEGKYDNFLINLGKMPFYTNADSGMLIDDFFSGAQIVYGDKFQAVLNAGRWKTNGSKLEFSDSSNYLGAELLYNDKKRFNFGVGYHHFKSPEFYLAYGYGDKDKASIVSVGAGYKFGDFKLNAMYAKNTSADNYNKSYNFELLYAGANREPGSWGLSVAYRYVGDNVSFAPTYDVTTMVSNKKGIDVGASWSPLKNTLTKINYFHGKTLDTNETTKTFFGRISFFF